MPTKRDKAFADRLTDTAISIDDLCDQLERTQDARADDIIASLRDIEFECNELAEKVSPQ
jgi:hypothetical protein